jgi:hypothetical protein
MKKNKNNVIEPIKIWRFEDAPLKYQDMSINGGDEDWVAEIPMKTYKQWGNDIPIFMQEGSLYGCCSVDELDYEFNGGRYKIVIGSHA